MEEAVKLQFIEGATLPYEYETVLFSLEQPITLRVGREVQASNTVGGDRYQQTALSEVFRATSCLSCGELSNKEKEEFMKALSYWPSGK